MPTNCDETLIERYQRDHEVYLGILARITPQEIFDLELKHHNALARITQLERQNKQMSDLLVRLVEQFDAAWDKVGISCYDIGQAREFLRENDRI